VRFEFLTTEGSTIRRQRSTDFHGDTSNGDKNFSVSESLKLSELDIEYDSVACVCFGKFLSSDCDYKSRCWWGINHTMSRNNTSINRPT
jgi:hypothetical protein